MLYPRIKCFIGGAFLVCLPSLAICQTIIPPKVYTVTPGYVNLADGSFALSETDFKFGSLALTRTHLGGPKDPDDPPFGPKMTSNFDIFVDEHPTSSGGNTLGGFRYKPVVNLGGSSSGIFVRYINPAMGPMWSSDESSKGYLEYISGAYRYTANDGTVYDFNPAVHIFYNGVQNNTSQRVAQITSPNGRIEKFLYDSNQRLKAVIANDGYAIAFDYNSTGKVSASCGYNTSVTYVNGATGCAGATLRAIYSYNSDGYLTSVTDPLSRVTSYGYVGAAINGSQISCYTPPGYTSCKISNTYSGQLWQVTGQIMADKSTWSFSYDGPGQVQDSAADYWAWDEPYNSTLVTDPNGKTFLASFNRYSPYSFTDQNGHKTDYRYRGGFEPEMQYLQSQKEEGEKLTRDTSEGEFLISAVYPEGNSYLANRTGPFWSLGSEISVEKNGNTATQHTIEYQYSDACIHATKPSGDCPKPIWIKDANGNKTDYIYASHGGLLSEMGPAPAGGGARPLKLTSWTQRYAWIKNANGTLVQSDGPIWMMDTQTQCQTTAGSDVATCDGGAPILTINYQYGAAGAWEALLVKGKASTSGGVTLRTCYTYDVYGRKISETSPNANLAVCP